MSERCLEIGLLRYPGAQLAAVYGLGDLFAVANRMAAGQGREGLPRLRVSHWQADEAGQLQRMFDSLPQAEGTPQVVILPPCLDDAAEQPLAAVYRDWLRAQHGAGVLLASVCAGAFALAESGLLDGRTVTTHWALAAQMAARFPQVQVLPERMVIDDGDLITAGGLMAWTDLGLAIVTRLLGPTIAAETARFLVVDLNRESQRHFSSFAPSLDHGDAAVLAVQRWLQGRRAPRRAWPIWPRVPGWGNVPFCVAFAPPPG